VHVLSVLAHKNPGPNNNIQEPAQLCRYSEVLRAGRPGFDSLQCNIFLFSLVGPFKPPIRRVSRAHSPGIKRQGREVYHSPPSSAEVMNVGAVPPLPYISYGIVLN
jgi:hypothetical protein